MAKKDEQVDKIWNTNRQYIRWLRGNVNLNIYPDEAFIIGLLVEEQ